MHRLEGYTIREAAKLSGLPESTLRYYEAIRLLDPVGRDASSGHRRYTEDDVDLAIAVACLNATGMSIDDMRVYLESRKLGDQSAQAQIELLESQRRRLAEEAHNLQLRQRYIEAKIAYWQAALSGDGAQKAVMGESARSIAKELRSPNVPAENA